MYNIEKGIEVTRMKKIKRAAHFDFHTMPGIYDFGSEFDAAEFAETLSDAHIEYINMFARCNIGFSYYPTKIGISYPTMKGDLFGDVLRECHRKGIGVTAYFNGGLNHELMLRQPGYMKINKDGSVYKGDIQASNFFRTPCFNTPYRQYLIEEIKEILSLEPDGIFCDCMIPAPCYCPECTKRMQAEGVDMADDDAVLDFALRTLREVFAEIRAVVPKDKRLIINSHPYDDLCDYQSHVEIECLTTGEFWGYDFLPAFAPYYRQYSDECIYMSGRFARDWGDFAGIKAIPAIENDVYEGLLYGYVPSVGDHLHPRGGLNKALYKEIGRIYEYVMELEPWTDGSKPKTEAAVLRNHTNSKNVIQYVSDSDRGAARVMAELKVSYDIVNEDMDFSPYKLLVLPDNIEITDKLVKKLENFRGAILSTGESIAKSKVWDYIEEYEKDTNTDGFFGLDGEVYAGYSCGIKMKSEHSISDYIEPYFNKGWDGLHSYYYIPYDKCIGYSAAAVKGNRAHIAFNIFDSYYKYGATFQKDFVKKIIDRILPERIINPETLPSTTRVSVMSGKTGDIMHVKTTFPEQRGKAGIIEEHVVLPAGRKVSIMGEYKSVVTLPEQKELEISVANGRTEITLPEITGYMPFLMTK